MLGLGRVYASFAKETGPEAGSNVTNAFSNTGYSHNAFLTPGTYRVWLTGYAPTNYNMTLGITSTGLSPDIFEVNNTVATPAFLPEGDYDVNLHVPTDVDYYQFTVADPGFVIFGSYVFEISNSDFPINVELFDAASMTLIDSSPGVKGYKRVIGGDLYGKKLLVHLTGGVKTRYEIQRSMRIDHHRFDDFVAYDPFWWLGGGPVEEVIDGPEDWVAVQVPRESGIINLFNSSLEISLYDLNGRLMLQGSPLFDGDFQYGQALNLADMRPGSVVLLRITRAEQSVVDREQAAADIGRMPYRLEFGQRESDILVSNNTHR